MSAQRTLLGAVPPAICDLVCNRRPADRLTGDPTAGSWIEIGASVDPGLGLGAPNTGGHRMPAATDHRGAPGRSCLVTYVDRTMTCVDCGVEFIHSAADQEFYAQKGFTSDPKRCTSCRAYRRSTRDGGWRRCPVDRRPAGL